VYISIRTIGGRGISSVLFIVDRAIRSYFIKQL
jgi:hypothetical protein